MSQIAVLSTVIVRGLMETARKITVEISSQLFEKAATVEYTDMTPTVRAGLRLTVACRTYARGRLDSLRPQLR